MSLPLSVSVRPWGLARVIIDFLNTRGFPAFWRKGDLVPRKVTDGSTPGFPISPRIWGASVPPSIIQRTPSTGAWGGAWTLGSHARPRCRGAQHVWVRGWGSPGGPGGCPQPGPPSWDAAVVRSPELPQQRGRDQVKSRGRAGQGLRGRGAQTQTPWVAQSPADAASLSFNREGTLPRLAASAFLLPDLGSAWGWRLGSGPCLPQGWDAGPTRAPGPDCDRTQGPLPPPL